MDRREEILGGNLWKIIIKLTIPVLFTNFIQTLHDLVDAYFVGQIGSEQVAAITFVWPIVFLIISLGIGLSIAGLSIIAQSIGRGDRNKVKENIQQLIYLALIVSIITGGAGLVFSESVLKFMGLKGILLQESSKYIKWILIGTPATFIILSHSAIRGSEGQNTKPMIVNIISIIANISLNPIFIFHFKMGIVGAALGTIVAKFGAAFYCYYDLAHNSENYSINLRFFNLKADKARDFIKIAIPAAFSRAATSFSFIVLNIFVKDYGAEILAAFGIGNRILSIFFMPADGIATSLAVIIGQNYGAENYRRVKESVKKGMIISLIFSCFGAITLRLFAEELSAVFSNDSMVLYHTVNYIKLLSFTIIAWGIYQVYIAYFQGLGQTKIVLKMNMIRLWGLRLPLFFIFSYLKIFQEYSVWNSMFFGNVFIALISIIIYKQYISSNNSVVEKLL